MKRYALYRCEGCSTVPQVELAEGQEPETNKFIYCATCGETKFHTFVPLQQWLRETV